MTRQPETRQSESHILAREVTVLLMGMCLMLVVGWLLGGWR